MKNEKKKMFRIQYFIFHQKMPRINKDALHIEISLRCFLHSTANNIQEKKKKESRGFIEQENNFLVSIHVEQLKNLMKF